MFSIYAYWSLVGDEHVVQHEFPGGTACVGFAKEWEYRCHDPFHAVNRFYKMLESRLNPEVIPAYYRQYDPYVEMLVRICTFSFIFKKSGWNCEFTNFWNRKFTNLIYWNHQFLNISLISYRYLIWLVHQFKLLYIHCSIQIFLKIFNPFYLFAPVEKYRVIEIVDRSTNLQAIKGWNPAPASTRYCNVSGLTILPPWAPLGSIVLN